MKRLVESWGIGLAVTLLAGAALASFLPGSSGAQAPIAGFRWVTYANTALAGSTAMYAVHLWLRTELVGRAATALAMAGALGVVAAVALGILRSGAAGLALYEATALFSAAAVVAYLGLERAYRSRSVGIAVMPVVMLAVLCEMWLIVQGLAAQGKPADGLSGYWEAACRFAMCLGYCPLAIAGGLAAVLLARRRGVDAVFPGAALSAAFSVGAPLLLLGAGMGAVGMLTDLGGPSRSAGPFAVSVVAAAVALLAWAGMRGQDDAQRARLALGVFIASTAGLLAAGWAGDAPA
jgi:hypothetical protein